MRAVRHRKPHSNTGIPGVSRTRRRGKDCLSVSWRSDRRERKATTIYFGTDSLHADYASALAAAIAIREAAIAARLQREADHLRALSPVALATT